MNLTICIFTHNLDSNPRFEVGFGILINYFSMIIKETRIDLTI